MIRVRVRLLRSRATIAILLAGCLGVAMAGVGCELAVQLDVEDLRAETDGAAPCSICLDGSVVTEPDGNVVIVFGQSDGGAAEDAAVDGAADDGSDANASLDASVKRR